MASAASSYTARRAHARTLDAGAPAPALRWRASFGPGGQLCFGSRSVVVASLGALDAACRPSDEPAPRARAEAALAVAARAAEEAPAATLAAYKAAAAGPDPPPSALAEQHVWKLAAALFLPAGTDGATEGALRGADEGAAAALLGERQREALRAWLRLALWDAAALVRARPDPTRLDSTLTRRDST
jgi:hypothetical protein